MKTIEHDDLINIIYKFIKYYEKLPSRIEVSQPIPYTRIDGVSIRYNPNLKGNVAKCMVSNSFSHIYYI